MEEVKLAIKPYYQKKDITKEEYKDILRKAVHKVGPRGEQGGERRRRRGRHADRCYPDGELGGVHLSGR